MKFTATLFMASSLVLGCMTPDEGDEFDEDVIGEETLEVEADAEQPGGRLPNNQPFQNATGASATFSTAGFVALEGPFFRDFGTNDRTCDTCHIPSDGWGISARTIRVLFDLTQGTHPIFRTVDGSNSPRADVSTVQKRRAAYSMLLNRGVIRIGIGIPATAEFELAAVDDPYGFASAAELSLFRRPIPSANLGFIPAVMWDGREATGATIPERLAVQANDATRGHAQAAVDLVERDRQAIVVFETALFNAQITDNVAGRLDDGARGGAQALSTMTIVNARFDLFDGWRTLTGTDARTQRRLAIGRGQELFNNPNAGAGGGACRGCHSVANAGSSAAPIFFNVGTSAGARRTADLPLYTLRNKTTGELRTTTDPGRALITGLWNDVDRFKAPVLRALSSRAPYFHAGSAATLLDVVRFYEQSLGFTFTAAEETDLVAFLSAL